MFFVSVHCEGFKAGLYTSRNKRAKIPIRMANTLSPTIFKVVLELVLGLGLSIAGISEMFPLHISLFLYLGAMVFIVIGLREAIKGLMSFPANLALYAAVIACYGYLISFPVVKQYKKEINLSLDFKEPANVSVFRKQLITYDIAKFRDFLSSLQIEVPTEVPPIAISTDVNDAKQTGSSTPPNLHNYRFELMIGRLVVLDRGAVTDTYSRYVFQQKWSKAARGIQVPAQFYILVNLVGIADYFNSSYWNKKSVTTLSLLTNYLWDLREHLGASFTDKLAAATVKTMVDASGEVIDADVTDVTTYSVRSLMIGDLIVEVNCNSWSQIAKVIEADGVPKSMINSQNFPHTSLHVGCSEAWKKY
jgi:hypothetical protein